jgi:hypothetical protein
MDGYRQFWNELVFGNEGIGPAGDLERYWIGVGVLALVCFLIGLASARGWALPALVTALFAGLYVAAVVPFMVWAASCTGCGASFSYDTARSYELILIERLYGGFFAKGIAALWSGALISRAVAVRLRF